MTLPLTGALSFDRIKSEAIGGGTPTPPYSLNAVDVRALAQVNTPDSLIKFSDFYGMGLYSDHILTGVVSDLPLTQVYISPTYNLAFPGAPIRGTLQNQFFKGKELIEVTFSTMAGNSAAFSALSALSTLSLKKIEWVGFDGIKKSLDGFNLVLYTATDTYPAFTKFVKTPKTASLVGFDWNPPIELTETQVAFRIYW